MADPHPASPSPPPPQALLREDLSRALIAVADFGSPSVISSACGLIVTIYMRFRPVLKIQLELWLTFVILPLAEGGSATPFEVQRAALEALADLCRQPTFITDLFCNYDCDIRCPNLFARTAALLCKSAFPVSGPMMATHSVALEAREREREESGTSSLLPPRRAALWCFFSPSQRLQSMHPRLRSAQ